MQREEGRPWDVNSFDNKYIKYERWQYRVTVSVLPELQLDWFSEEENTNEHRAIGTSKLQNFQHKIIETESISLVSLFGIALQTLGDAMVKHAKSPQPL